MNFRKLVFGCAWERGEVSPGESGTPTWVGKAASKNLSLGLGPEFPLNAFSGYRRLTPATQPPTTFTKCMLFSV